MALRIGLSGIATLVGIALVAGCASEDSGTGLGNPGGGGKAGIGGYGGGIGGAKTGGSGGLPFGGSGGTQFGGAGGSFGGAPPGGTGGIGGAPIGGGTGGVPTGGTGGGSTQDSCVGWCGKTDPAPGPAQCYCDTECFNYGDCCADYSVCSGGGGTGGGGTGGGGTGGVGGSTGGVGGSTGGSGGTGGSVSGSCVGSCGVQAPSGCWCDNSCKSIGDCCADKDSVCGTSTGGTGGTGGTVGGGGSGGTGGTTGGGGGTGGVVGSCMNAEDCSNPATMICDPDTLKCGAGQCTATQACTTGEICLAQVSQPAVGACYTSCTPFTTGSCGTGKDCVGVNLDLSDGACFNSGTKTEAQACTYSDVNTGCTLGYLCVRDVGTYVCRKDCNYFTSSPGCLLQQRCVLGGVCSAESGDSAALGAKCSVSSAAGENCGNDGKAWRGTCQDMTGSGSLTCLKVCRTSVATDCSSSQQCQPFQGDSTAGVCY